MRYLDRTEIFVEAGKGGDGRVSFYRARYVPKGGPDGGDGGNGGDVWIVADRNLFSLEHLPPGEHLKAEDGEPGKNQKMHGKNGKDLIIKVPVGTDVIDVNTGEIIARLDKDGEKVLVARGGKGGKGNVHFKNSTNRTPMVATKGTEGEKRTLILDWKIPSDIALVGFPNSGKSSLLATLTNATPKIAPYPYTTTIPEIGTLIHNYKYYTILELPPIPFVENPKNIPTEKIRFLKHLEKTKLITYTISVESQVKEEIYLLKEIIGNFSKELLKKPQAVILTKIDLVDEPTLEKMKKEVKESGIEYVFLFSTKFPQHISNLVECLTKCLD